MYTTITDQYISIHMKVPIQKERNSDFFNRRISTTVYDSSFIYFCLQEYIT